MEMTEQIDQISTALSLAQAEVTSADKDRVNPHFKQGYATLASVWDACRAALTKQGIAVIQSPFVSGQTVTLVTLLTHKSGQWFKNTLTMTATNAAPQSIGSAITYARRYSLSAMVGVAPDDDDDGNAGSGKPNTKNNSNYEAPPFVQTEESPEIQTGWRKLRASLNKTLSTAKTSEELQAKRKPFEDYCKNSESIWNQRTYHNEDETFGMLFEQHKSRVMVDDELNSPAGINRWLDAVSKSDEKAMLQRIAEYKSQVRLQNLKCESALDERAIELGFPAYVEMLAQAEEV